VKGNVSAKSHLHGLGFARSAQCPGHGRLCHEDGGCAVTLDSSVLAYSRLAMDGAGADGSLSHHLRDRRIGLAARSPDATGHRPAPASAHVNPTRCETRTTNQGGPDAPAIPAARDQETADAPTQAGCRTARGLHDRIQQAG